MRRLEHRLDSKNKAEKDDLLVPRTFLYSLSSLFMSYLSYDFYRQDDIKFMVINGVASAILGVCAAGWIYTWAKQKY